MNQIIENKLKNCIRNIPDFPKPGILFKDLTTLFKEEEMFRLTVDELYQYYKSMKISKVVGIESRGFIAGGALSIRLGAGFVPARKPGKLPGDTYKKEYFLEYGKDSIEIHKDALTDRDIVLIHDDLLATGGTSKAAYDLVSMFKVKKIFINFIVELAILNGRQKFDGNTEIFSLLSYST